VLSVGDGRTNARVTSAPECVRRKGKKEENATTENARSAKLVDGDTHKHAKDNDDRTHRDPFVRWKSVLRKMISAAARAFRTSCSRVKTTTAFTLEDWLASHTAF
jgi:hypothetical protein